MSFIESLVHWGSVMLFLFSFFSYSSPAGEAQKPPLVCLYRQRPLHEAIRFIGNNITQLESWFKQTTEKKLLISSIMLWFWCEAFVA